MKTSIAVLATLCAILPVSSQAAWHAIMISGDDSIDNFDNSRMVLGEMFARKGLEPANQHHLNSQFPDVLMPKEDQASFWGLSRSLSQLNVQPKQDACLFYVTCHGQRTHPQSTEHSIELDLWLCPHHRHGLSLLFRPVCCPIARRQPYHHDGCCRS